MAKLMFGMNQSLDGYVNHMAFAPSPTLFRHSLTWQPTSERKRFLPSPTTKLTGQQILGPEVAFLPLCPQGCGPASATHSLHRSDTFTGPAQKSPNDGAVFSRERC
jgi:hypothetical protein